MRYLNELKFHLQIPLQRRRHAQHERAWESPHPYAVHQLSKPTGRVGGRRNPYNHQRCVFIILIMSYWLFFAKSPLIQHIFCGWVRDNVWWKELYVKWILLFSVLVSFLHNWILNRNAPFCTIPRHGFKGSRRHGEGQTRSESMSGGEPDFHRRHLHYQLRCSSRNGHSRPLRLLRNGKNLSGV